VSSVGDSVSLFCLLAMSAVPWPDICWITIHSENYNTCTRCDGDAFSYKTWIEWQMPDGLSSDVF